MQDIGSLPTRQFTEQQRKEATRALDEINRRDFMNDINSSETEKTPSAALGKEDVIARFNALLKYVPSLRCYAVLQNKVYVQIEEMALTPNGYHVHCLLKGERQKGTAVTVPYSGPFLLYIED